MKKILILNFGSSKDILMSSHLISALKTENPNSRITICVFEKHRDITMLLSGINDIQTINSDFIIEAEQNDLYPDAYALNEFSNNVQGIVTDQWDTVVNYSNDNVSAYLMGALNATNLAGSYINDAGVAKTDSKWATLQNYVLAANRSQTIATPLVRNLMLNVPIYSDVQKININEDFMRVASQNFEKVRQMKGHARTKIIGINLEVGYSGYATEFRTLLELIETFEESEQFKVVLLTSGKSYQKEIVNKLNEFFDNKLISINVDTVATSAVVSNIDLLISSANNQSYIADALEVKVVEVKGSDLSIAPSVIGVDNIVIYQQDERLLANDIILAVNEEFETELPISSLTTTNPTFLCIQDEYGVSYSQVRGNINVQQELKIHIERAILFQTMGFAKDEQLIQQIQNGMSKEDIEEFVTTVKSEVTVTVKLLLASLRSLKGAKSSRNQVDTFIGYLGNLIQAGNGHSISASLVKMFEGNIENINSTDMDSNMQEIENYLFELKTNLQTLMNYMSEILEQPEQSRGSMISAE